MRAARGLISCSLLSFVMVNSMALEGDGCTICSGEEAELLEISHRLNCSREVGHPRPCRPWPAPVSRVPPHRPVSRDRGVLGLRD